MRHLRNPFSAHLQRRIFFWFGAAILSTGLLVGMTSHLLGGEYAARRDIDSARLFAGHVLGDVWERPDDRERLLRRLHDDLGVDVAMENSSPGVILLSGGAHCFHPLFHVPVEHDGQSVGTASVCLEPSRRGFSPRGLLLLCVALGVLWGISGFIARRLSRPFRLLAREAERIAQGDLGVRRDETRERDREARLLSEVLAQMKERIRKQLDDQRALLAAVSHEIRSPLARMRLLVEFAAQGKGDSLAKLDGEIAELDTLVGDLLASSRIDFAAVGRAPLDATEVAILALERAEVDPSLLDVEGAPLTFEGDATLASRAVSNLLDNAKKYGNGAVALHVRRQEGKIVFDVDDGGPGIAPGAEKTIFEPFARKHHDASATSAGLGLALVKRIAEAHGGEAHASNLPQGGARFGFSVAARRGPPLSG